MTSGNQILLVDDSAEDREYVKRLLRKAHQYDWQFLEAGNGAAGLALSQDVRVDCLLLDFRLPDMDGIEFMQRLTEFPAEQTFPVVMITGTGDEALAVRSLQSGAFDYLSKAALTAEALLGAVENARARFRLLAENKSSARKLKESEELLRLAYRSAQVAPWEWNLIEGTGVWNPELRSMFGLAFDQQPPCRAEVLSSLLHPADFPAILQHVREAIQSGELLDITVRICRADGVLRWVNARGQIYCNDQGRPERIVGIATDVTSHKESEETLRENRQVLEAALESSGVAVCRWDLQTGALQWTGTPARLFGLEADQAPRTAHEFAALVYPEDRDRIAAAIGSSAATGAGFENDYRVVWPDGEVRWLTSRGKTYFDAEGRPAYLIGSGWDITERKRTEYLLQRAHSRFQKLVDSNIVGIVTANQQGILEANDDFLNMLGHTREDLEHGRVNWLEATPEEYRFLDFQGIEQLKQSGFCVPFEKEYIRKDGTRIPVLIGAAALAPEPELEWIAFVVDQTERKRLESQLRTSNDELERFAFAASHDLKDPLRTIAIFCQMLSRDVPLNDESTVYLGQIQDAVKRMQALIGGLLDYAQLTHEFTREQNAIGSEGPLVEAIWNLDAAIQESGAEISYHAMPIVIGERRLLGQLFQNLIGNGIKYRGGQTPRIEIWAERSGNDWNFSISDNGIGFDMKYAEQIFGVFKRLHSSDEYAGTGIGLALCKRIVERYGGRIRAVSEPGKGSTFSFNLKAAEAAAKAAN